MLISNKANWLAIVLQGLLGALMGTLAGGLLIMNRITKFLAKDEESSLVMLLGCIFIGTGLFMRFGDAILVPTRTIPQIPIQHSKLSLLITTVITVTGFCILFYGFFLFFQK